MDEKKGIVGAIVTFVTAIFGWLMKHEAELRAASRSISIIVGLLTAAWWVRKFYRAFKKRADEL
jgi:hypothetical protein